jgi:D-psicose/D-tagatose/L-ribulose 3-epimerase
LGGIGLKLGVCTELDNAKLLLNNGFDYIEMGLSGIAALSEKEFLDLKEKVEASPLKPYAFNVMLPGSIKVTGNNVNKAEIKEYIEKAYRRASELGGKIVVFGSGGSRRVPEGFSHDTAFEQLVSFLKIAAPIAEKNSITIAIEPLRAEETNIINCAKDGLKLAKAVNNPHVRLLVDFYHMYCENENADIIIEAGSEYIKHIHIANPNGRVWPLHSSEADYTTFFGNLRKIGYSGGISIEAKTDNIKEDAPQSFKCLTNL